VNDDSTTNNPYRAPDAPVHDVVHLEATPPPPRPRAVMFTVIVGWLFVVIGGYGVVRATTFFVRYWDVYRSLGSAYVAIAWRAAFVVLCLAMVISLHRRRPLGRWLGALFIGIIGAYCLYLTFRDRGPDVSFAYRLGSYSAGLAVFVAPVTWWFYTFTLSRKARAWFSQVPGPDAPR
jgi:hypothetical protein